MRATRFHTLAALILHRHLRPDSVPLLRPPLPHPRAGLATLSERAGALTSKRLLLRSGCLLAGVACAGNRAAGKWSMAGPTGPPGHEQLEAQREPASLIMSQAPMVQILTLTVEDTR